MPGARAGPGPLPAPEGDGPRWGPSAPSGEEARRPGAGLTDSPGAEAQRRSLYRHGGEYRVSLCVRLIGFEKTRSPGRRGERRCGLAPAGRPPDAPAASVAGPLGQTGRLCLALNGAGRGGARRRTHVPRHRGEHRGREEPSARTPASSDVGRRGPSQAGHVCQSVGVGMWSSGAPR